LISHDRYFLDQVVSTIIEMTPAVYTYHGNYSAYLRQRQERWDRMIEIYESEMGRLEKDLDYVKRNISGQNVRQARGRLRRLERLLGGRDAHTALVDRPRDSASLKLDLQTTLRSGDRVIETHDLAVGYPDDRKVLFRAPDLLLWREECAALVGPNGAGKTTFLKTLLGEVPPLSGKVRLGSSLKVGYFSQAHEGLVDERTVLEELRSVAEMPPGRARDYLAKFLFTGDDVLKRVAVLSGGERGRLALAKLALEGANLLLLDEPTNHLDIPAQEVLEAVMANFAGTILLVSHDRYLIDALATQVWALEEGELAVFKGSWSEYVAWRQAQAAGAPVAAPSGTTMQAGPGALSQRGGKAAVARGGRRGRVMPTTDDGRPTTRQPGSAADGEDARLARQQKAAERKRAARLGELETEIGNLEQRLADLARDLEEAGTGADVARVRALGEEYAQVQADLDARLGEWETLAL
jgi:ATP-binding cassette subfamily F protein 3